MRLVVLSLLGVLLPHFSSGARPAFRVRDASYPQSERTDQGDAVLFGRRTANTRPLIGVITQVNIFTWFTGTGLEYFAGLTSQLGCHEY